MLDRLDPAKIPVRSRFAKQPEDLVAVLGVIRDEDFYTGMRCLAFLDGGKWLVSGGGDKALHVWDMASLREVATIGGHADLAELLAASEDGQTLASSDKESVRVWKFNRGRPTLRAVLKPGARFKAGVKPQALALSRDGKMLAAGTDDGHAQLWDLTDPKPRDWDEIPASSKAVEAVAFSPDGKTLATGGWDSTLRLWDVSGDKYKQRAEVENMELLLLVRSMAFSPDRTVLATGRGGGDIVLWKLGEDAPRESGKLQGHRKPLTGFAFSPDGKSLVSADSEGRVLLWDVAAASKVKEWRLPSPANGIAFAPDGRHFATANDNGTIYVLRVGTPPAETASERAEREKEEAAEKVRLKEEGSRKSEQDAARKLRLAKMLAADGLNDKAKQRLRDIVNSYPNTKAAAEAKRLLDELD